MPVGGQVGGIQVKATRTVRLELPLSVRVHAMRDYHRLGVQVMKNVAVHAEARA